MDVLVSSTLVLRDALPNLRKHAYPEIIEAQRKIKTMEKEGDTIFRAATLDDAGRFLSAMTQPGTPGVVWRTPPMLAAAWRQPRPRPFPPKN